MEIEFDVQLGDCIALNQHVIKTTPMMKKVVIKGQIWWASGPFLGVTLLSIIRKIPFEKAIVIIGIITVVCSIPAFFLYPLYFKKKNRKFIKRSCESEKNKGIVGKHIIQITDGNFQEKTDYNNTTIPWKGIDRIEKTKEHIFIFVNEITAYIVPRKSLDEDDYNRFSQVIDEKFNKNNG
jgi:hypothetical protein